MPESREWSQVHNLEDIQSLIATMAIRVQVIEAQAFCNGSYDQIFDEAVALKAEFEEVRAFLSAGWFRVTEILAK